NRYHVRYGPAVNPAVSISDDGLFTLHYVHMAAELWIDSVAGWLTVIDNASRFAMVERFEYEPTKTYPGRASVIFWTNGRGIHLDKNGEAAFDTDRDSPYYMEAELNSPMCHLKAGEACQFNTDWFPTRAERNIANVVEPGVIVKNLEAARS